MMADRLLQLQPLTADAFAPFGIVVETGGMTPQIINDGHTRKFPNLLPFDCDHECGRVAVHLYRSAARQLPLEIRCLERHPLGSQAFWPLQVRPYVVVVSPPGPELDESAICAFLAGGHQAIQYHRGTWHHYQISLEAESDYLVLDREGPGDNCEEWELVQPLLITL
jgi:ureidoglycolate lyase